MYKPIEVNEALMLNESDPGCGWYTIERKTCGRISDADVEGSASDMLGIADAIERRGRYSERRCRVRVEGDKAYFCSPRNSTRETVVPLAVADELAREIRAKLGTRHKLLADAVTVLAGDSNEGLREAVHAMLSPLEEEQIRLLFQLAARVAAKDGAEGFLLPEESE